MHTIYIQYIHIYIKSVIAVQSNRQNVLREDEKNRLKDSMQYNLKRACHGTSIMQDLQTYRL